MNFGKEEDAVGGHDQPLQIEDVPHPVAISLHQGVNPLTDLLLSFPAPQYSQMSSLTSLSSSQDTDVYTGAELKHFSQQIQNASRSLFQSGLYTNFLQEKLSAEGSVSPTGSTLSSEASGISAAAGAEFLHEELSRAWPSHLSAATQSIKLERAGSRAPKVDSCSHQTNVHMTLRPRRSLEVKEEAQEIAEVESKLRKPTPTHRKTAPTTTPQRQAIKLERAPSPPHCVDEHFRNTVSEIVRDRMVTAPALQSIITALPFDMAPFKDTALADLTAYVSALTDPTSAQGNITTTSITETNSDEVQWQQALQGLACATCVSHPSFQVEAVLDGMMDRLTTIFSSAVNSATTIFSRAVLEEDTIITDKEEDNATGGGPTITHKKEQVRWLELLRGYLRRFAEMVCHRTLDLITDGDVARLEDLCFRCLFIVPHRCSKTTAELFTSYVMDSAVHLYQCVWNRLEGPPRYTIAETFFPKLLISDVLLHRTFITTEGRNVMPLTMAVLAAAQSVPFGTEPITTLHVEHLQKQCSVWCDGIIQHLLLGHMGDDKAEQGHARTLALQLMEDLADLLGSPEWPVADLLLRYCVLALHASLTIDASTLSAAQVDLLRSLTVDVIGNVALRLCESPSAQGSAQTSAELLAGPLQFDSLVETHWKRALRRSATEEEEAQQGAQKRRKKDDAIEEGEEPPEGTLQHADMLAMALYYGMSRKMETPACDQVSVWLHTRAAHLLVWHNLSPKLLPTEALEPLTRDMTCPCGRVESDLALLHTYAQALTATFHKSMLSARMRQTLISFLLSVFHLKDANGTEIAASDVVLKKVLSHLSKLTMVYPMLSTFIWPITRNCVRGESARVRESIAPLLLTILKGILTMANENGSETLASEQHMIADIISSLLHLLEDKSVTVVSRAVASLDTLLTNVTFSSLLSTPQGDNLLSFAQHKLLALVVPDGKHTSDVTRHFLRRWVVTPSEDEVNVAGNYAQLAKEMVTLTVQDCGEYPYEVDEHQPIVQLLRHMRDSVNSTTTAPGRRRTKHAVDEGELQQTMRSTARAMWTRLKTADTTEDMVGTLVTLRAMAIGSTEWVEPLAVPLMEALESPPQILSSALDKTDARGASILQITHILSTLLSSPKVPVISLEHLARSLTSLLSKYVGPFQQRIIEAACAALTAMITCGSTGKLSGQVKRPYIVLCYSLMNNYYVRVCDLLRTIGTQPSNMNYIRRFLFLLSEFLRLYPGWKQPPSYLLEDSATGTTTNLLAKGVGVCKNVYALLEKTLASCDPVTRGSVAVIVLRVLTSLCMLDPTPYWPQAEPFVRAALSPDADVALQIQGLTLIRDFLSDEDARVDQAARMASRLEASAVIAGHTHSGGSSEDSGDETDQHQQQQQQQRSRFLKSLPPAMEDQNSGMATWVMMQFHAEVLTLCESPQVKVRQRCLEVLQWAAQGGLLPPSKYLEALISLSADVHLPLRQKAAQCLQAHADRHEEIISTLSTRGILKAYDVHHACGVDLIRSAYTPAELVAESSVHASTYNLLHKKYRDNLITSLLRFFYQEGRAQTWCSSHHTEYKALGSSDGAAIAANHNNGEREVQAEEQMVLRCCNPQTLLAHLAVVIVLCPFTSESDLVHVLQHCRNGIDLNGQSMFDLVKQVEEKVTAGTPIPDGFDQIALYKCTGVILLYYMRRAICSEYHLTAAKLQRYMTGTAHSSSLGSRQPRSAVILSFFSQLSTYVRRVAALAFDEAGVAAMKDAAAWRSALAFLHSELEEVVINDAARSDVCALGEGTKKRAARGRGRPQKAAVKRRRRRTSSSSSSSSSSESESSDSSSGSSTTSSSEDEDDT